MPNLSSAAMGASGLTIKHILPSIMTSMISGTGGSNVVAVTSSGAATEPGGAIGWCGIVSEEIVGWDNVLADVGGCSAGTLLSESCC